MATVHDLPTATVTGQYLFVSQDNADEGTAPNSVLVTGYVRFTCSATPPLIYREKKVHAVPLVADATFDSQGHLVPLDPTQGVAVVVNGKLERGLELLADSPQVQPRGFTWQVSFNLKEAITGRAISIPPYSFKLSEGETVDLTEVAAIPASNGKFITQGKSAFEVAQLEGFKGTRAQWIESLKIKGDKGDKGDSIKGDKGDSIKGDKGDTGPANTLTIGVVKSASKPAATLTGKSPAQTLNLDLPKGEKGDKGNVGTTPDIQIGTVTVAVNPQDDTWMADTLRKGPESQRAIIETLPETFKGDQGVVGPRGATGPTGPRGERGPQGLKGDQGIEGPVGPKGPKGDRGEKGTTGDRGPTGDRGLTGPTGSRGPQGLNGVSPDIEIGTVTMVPSIPDDDWVAAVLNSGPKSRIALANAIRRVLKEIE